MPKTTSRGLTIGDHFQAIQPLTGGASSRIWCVDALFTGRDGIPHVRLSRADTRSELKTLAAATILDRNSYRRVD